LRIDIKAFPVVFAQSELLYGCPMLTGAIAFIAVPAIVRKFMMKISHVFVPPGLGQNTSGGDGGIDGVTLNDAAMGGAPVFNKAVAVDKQQPGPFLQFIQGQVHGLEGGFEDIDLVYFFMIHHAHPIAQGIRLDKNTQFLPVVRAHLFGIIQQRVEKTFREDDSCCEYRAGITASACFITTCFQESFLIITLQQIRIFFKNTGIG